MHKEQAIRTLKAQEAELRALGVQRLSLFGSLARGEARPDSDVDIAAEFNPKARVGMVKFGAIDLRLHELLGVPVDLVGEPARRLRCRSRSTGIGFVYSERVRQRLQHIVENAERIETYVDSMEFDTFAADRKTIDAVERCPARITEASVRIGDAVMPEIAPDVPMHTLRGFGNALRHDYDRIDLPTIWATVKDDLPGLRAACERALASD